jgi:hypothetical protein
MRCSLLVPFLFAAACSSALADQPAAPQPPAPPPAQIALANAPVKLRAPYDVQILHENGESLPTYGLKDRFYVQGNAGERYVIRITNPTEHRIEAVVSVDGLDVVDGEAGDLHKRGYVIPPHGETRVEGFRTSTADVATFRFSSVDGSYAGEKGNPRNVGVIAVALFEEQPQTELAEPELAARDRRYDYRDDLDDASAGRGERNGPAPETATAGSPAPSPAAPPVASRVGRAQDRDVGVDDESRAIPGHTSHTERPGLGTQFGEQRYSAASFTRFVRAGDRPVAIAELRYNDAAGLIALGIPVQPVPDDGELMTRETAEPFPGDERFARPVR